VGSEARAWNHADVHATTLAFYYDSEAVAEYRNRFRQEDEALRGEIATLIAAHHAHLSPSIGYEERWLLADLEKAPNPADIQDFLWRIVRTRSYALTAARNCGRKRSLLAVKV
jgi:hypothetical protein